MKKIVFTFGRYNPPTTGHAELITYAVKLAQRTGADHRIYTSNSHDASKNPLSPRQKVSFLKQIFPGVNFIADPAMKTAFAICKKLTDEGYEDVTFVVGDDRVAEFTRSLSKYVKPKTAKDFNPKIHYPFKKFKVVSSGARKQGISGTDLRAAVRKGDFATFAKASAARDKSLARKIFTATRTQLSEQFLHEEMTRKEFTSHLNSFVDFCCNKLSILDKPSLKFKEPTDQGEQPSFAAYAPGAREVHVMSKNRHPMDIFRSVAHELVHHKQNEEGRIGKDIAKEGATGSDIENEANSKAGELMRWYGKAFPASFSMSYVIENKAIVLAGVPGSGKDKILKETILPFGFTEISSETYSTPSDRLVVVNGTSNYERIRFIKEDLEKAGYETIMLFVNTSNEVSRQRNEARGDKGGRVINEAVRYTKWKNAQDTLDRYDDLFERVIVVQNDLDLNQSIEVIQETHHKLVEMVSEDIRQFSLAPVDKKFENMLEGYTDFSINNRQNPTGGAGNWGTSKLADKYKSDTPGQVPGKNLEMGYFQYAKTKAPQVKVFGNLPKQSDRVGQTFTSAKNPSFVGDITSDQNAFSIGEPLSNWSAIDRWSMREETRNKFKARYGKLAEQKIKETAEKLRKESLYDPLDPPSGATPNAGNASGDGRPDINAKFELMSIAKNSRKLNNKKEI
jgi:Zeta toxin/Cytidylyltransferase-like